MPKLWPPSSVARSVFSVLVREKFDSLFPVVAIAIILLSTSVRVACAKTFFEDFENPTGTDNTYTTTWVGETNQLNPNFSSPVLPSSWGKKSGEVFLGPPSSGPKGAFWLTLDNTDSPTGYLYQGSFFIALNGLDPTTPGPLSGAVQAGWQVANLAIAKPTDWRGNVAAWRLGIINWGGQLDLWVIFGWNSETNNPDATMYLTPIAMNEAYTTAIYYDTLNRSYAWVVDGKTEVAAAMPSDYPEIGAEIIGDSGSAMGRNTAYIVDNISWTELPSNAPVPEPATWTLACLGFVALAYAYVACRNSRPVDLFKPTL